jgi:hypothetical protein
MNIACEINTYSLIMLPQKCCLQRDKEKHVNSFEKQTLTSFTDIN